MATDTHSPMAKVINRVYTPIVTDGDAVPGTDPNQKCYWIVRGEEENAQPELLLVDNLLDVPSRSALCTSIEEGVISLLAIKKNMFPNMSMKSGLQVSIVHTEAVYEPEAGIHADMTLFPAQFIAVENIGFPNGKNPFQTISTPPEKRLLSADGHTLLKSDNITSIAGGQNMVQPPSEGDKVD